MIQIRAFNFDTENKELGISVYDIKKNWLRNQQVALELSVSHKIVTPTIWQRSQLPKVFEISEVIFDGVNTDIFSPSKKYQRRTASTTYGTRGLEPMRAFPQFIRNIPILLNKYPQINIEIAGDDKMYYGNDA